jgi:hypothetical protein
MKAAAQEIHPGLWQGQWPPPGPWLARRGFSTVVLCAFEYQPPHVVPPHVAMMPGMRDTNPWPGVEVVYAPNDDDFDHAPPRETVRLAIKAARVVAARLAEGRKVLVTCWQGKNRSGLVSALGLHFHLGISGADATRIVQTRRSHGLRNPIFCEMLSRLGKDSEHHLHQAVAAKPLPPKPDFHRIATRWATQRGFTLPPGVL